jgi:hypothetical protein
MVTAPGVSSKGCANLETESTIGISPKKSRSDTGVVADGDCAHAHPTEQLSMKIVISLNT